MGDLGKIDVLRRRYAVSYLEAGELLAECDGQLLKALAILEQRDRNSRKLAEQHTWELVEEYVKRL